MWCGILSTEFEVKCVSQTVDIKTLNLGSDYSQKDIPCLNSSNGTDDSEPFRRTRYQLLLHNSWKRWLFIELSGSVNELV